jgi:hypothetical protein
MDDAETGLLLWRWSALGLGDLVWIWGQPVARRGPTRRTSGQVVPRGACGSSLERCWHKTWYYNEGNSTQIGLPSTMKHHEQVPLYDVDLVSYSVGRAWRVERRQAPPRRA